jgi:UDP-N-acetylglucosamine 3-dehydrogenase
MNDRLRAGVVGLGMMGRNHARVYREAPDVELVAVADIDRSAREAVSRDTAVRSYADAVRMLAEEQLDLVSVAAPTSSHAEIALEALGRGVNVLVEKPIATERAEAQAMIDAARAAGRILTVGHIERFNPAVREMKARLAAGQVGRVFQVRAARLGPFPARIRDVGVVVDLATHDLDVMRYLLGSDPVRLYAETEQRIHTEHEDLFCGLLKFANGAVGLLDINWLTPTKERRLSVTGERGMLVADYLTQDLRFYPNPVAAGDRSGAPVRSVAEGEVTEIPVTRREPLAVELAEFARAVRDGGPPPVDPRDAMIALLLARKMVESADRGEALRADALAEALA